MNSRYVLGLRVDVTSYKEAARQVGAWAKERRGRTVCCANVHMVMEGHRDMQFRAAVNSADIVTADGMPLVWALRGSGAEKAGRVYGPDLMTSVLSLAARDGIPVGFYGATEATLARLSAACRRRHPGLEIAFCYAPPFRDLEVEEEDDVVRRIEESGARILFVGLGCPKQERWMAGHRTSIRCVQLGVGAAFDQLAGVTPRAPAWMQASGLEWLFRLAVEPRRLWRRYFYTNSAFVLRLLGGWLRTEPAVRKASS
ncbi:MAG: WecB/TagA/CpsF family glycosyltransferase [Bryobacterales bacterium]|nr:WecB/TagA/CpsF family glycosyltransferase [Bryobacterales bacterium]